MSAAVFGAQVFAALGDATWSRLFRAKARRDEAAALVLLMEACAAYKGVASAAVAGAGGEGIVSAAAQDALRAIAGPLYDSFLRRPRRIPAMPMGLRRCVCLCVGGGGRPRAASAHAAAAAPARRSRLLDAITRGTLNEKSCDRIAEVAALATCASGVGIFARCGRGPRAVARGWGVTGRPTRAAAGGWGPRAGDRFLKTNGGGIYRRERALAIGLPARSLLEVRHLCAARSVAQIVRVQAVVRR